MTAAASAVPVSVKTGAQSGDCATHWPATTASRIRTKPMAEASSTRPGRQKRMYRPMSIAIGMVMAMVKAPQGDALSALTTTSARTASRMIMMARTETMATRPAAPADLLARHLAERVPVAPQRDEQDDEVLDAAAEHRPRHDPERPRQVAELRGEGRADERPRPRDRREVVAEHDPAVRGHEVAAVVEALRRGGAGASRARTLAAMKAE